MRDSEIDSAPVWRLEHEVQAQALADLLAEHRIPHLIERYADRAYDTIYIPQRGYGVIRVYEDDHERAEGLIRNFLAQLKRERSQRG